ncbi:MAG: tetratricopeptide repeat protein, partial [Verrucomicrobiota bacterium]|nr:tetratricopeptide repeat protein [Verrucomicrobiota bacterium]
SAIEEQYRQNPTNLSLVLQMATVYLQMQRTNEAMQLLEQIPGHPSADGQVLLNVAQVFSQMGNVAGLERCLVRLVQIMPESPEAWYDLSRAQAVQGKTAQALQSLSRALPLSDKRLQQQPNAPDLRKDAATNPTLAGLRQLPEFLKIIAPK